MNSSGSETVERMVLILILLIVALTVYSKLVHKVQESFEKAVKGDVKQMLAVKR